MLVGVSFNDYLGFWIQFASGSPPWAFISSRMSYGKIGLKNLNGTAVDNIPSTYLVNGRRIVQIDYSKEICRNWVLLESQGSYNTKHDIIQWQVPGSDDVSHVWIRPG